MPFTFFLSDFLLKIDITEVLLLIKLFAATFQNYLIEMHPLFLRVPWAFISTQRIKHIVVCGYLY